MSIEQQQTVSGVKQKTPQDPLKEEREKIRTQLLPEKEREKQDEGRSRGMCPETHNINSKKVVFVGASHIFNAPEEERGELKNQLNKAINDFSTETQDQPVTYIVEGQVPKEEEFEKMQDYESVITIKQAKRNPNPYVEYISGEPDPSELFSLIQESQEYSEIGEGISVEGLGNFDKSDLTLLYFFFRDCKLDKGLSDNKNIMTILNIVDKFKDFSFFDVSDLKKHINEYPDTLNREQLLQKALPLITEIVNKLNSVQTYFEQNYSGQTPKDIVENYDSSLETETSPNLRSGINSIAIIVRRERDVKLLQQIQDKTKEGRNVLVVYGNSHQTRTRPALEAMSQN